MGKSIFKEAHKVVNDYLLRLNYFRTIILHGHLITSIHEPRESSVASIGLMVVIVNSLQKDDFSACKMMDSSIGKHVPQASSRKMISTLSMDLGWYDNQMCSLVCIDGA